MLCFFKEYNIRDHIVLDCLSWPLPIGSDQPDRHYKKINLSGCRLRKAGMLPTAWFSACIPPPRRQGRHPCREQPLQHPAMLGNTRASPVRRSGKSLNSFHKQIKACTFFITWMKQVIAHRRWRGKKGVRSANSNKGHIQGFSKWPSLQQTEQD